MPSGRGRWERERAAPGPWHYINTTPYDPRVDAFGALDKGSRTQQVLNFLGQHPIATATAGLAGAGLIAETPSVAGGLRNFHDAVTRPHAQADAAAARERFNANIDAENPRANADMDFWMQQQGFGLAPGQPQPGPGVGALADAAHERWFDHDRLLTALRHRWYQQEQETKRKMLFEHGFDRFLPRAMSRPMAAGAAQMTNRFWPIEPTSELRLHPVALSQRGLPGWHEAAPMPFAAGTELAPFPRPEAAVNATPPGQFRSPAFPEPIIPLHFQPRARPQAYTNPLRNFLLQGAVGGQTKDPPMWVDAPSIR